METETTKPLYKVLNAQRTQGNWRADQRSEPEKSRMPFAIIVPFHGSCQPIFDSAAFPPNNEGNLHRMEGDALYTVLAVNNLHHLAEALEGMLDMLNNNSENIKALRTKVKAQAREALSRIS